MKKLLSMSLCLALVLGLLSGCGGSPAASTPAAGNNAGNSSSAKDESKAPVSDPVVIQLGHCDASSPDNGYQIYATMFKEYLEEVSGGQMSIEIFGDSILGGERDLMEGMNLGTIDLSIVSNMYVSNFVEDFKVFDLPYVFADYEKAAGVFADEALVSPVFQKLEESNNTKILSTGTIGFRHVINTVRPIEKVSDLAGMKIRVPETPILVGDFTAFGANCTTTAWSEAFTAVQQKTVDGLEVTTSAIYTGRFWEICDYMSLTKHMYQPLHLMVSTYMWDTLTEEQQGWMQEAAKLAAENQVSKIADMEQSLLDEMNSAGCAVNEVDLNEFKAACESVYTDVRAIIGDELVDAVVAKGAA